MKVLRFSYIKNCATKAKNWFAVTARRFHASRQTRNPSFSSCHPPVSVPSSDVQILPPTLPRSSTPPNSTSTNDIIEQVTPHLYGTINCYTMLSIPYTSTPTAPTTPMSIDTTSPMSIDTTSLLTPQFCDPTTHYTIASTSHRSIPRFASRSPMTPFTRTSIPSDESSQTSMVSTRANPAGQNIFQQIVSIHRLSPSPSFSRQPSLVIDASPPDCLTQLAPRTPRPYAYISPQDSFVPLSPPAYHTPLKRSFSYSVDDDLNAPRTYKRNKLNNKQSFSLPMSHECNSEDYEDDYLNAPQTYKRNKLDNKRSFSLPMSHESNSEDSDSLAPLPARLPLFRKRPFSALMNDDQPELPIPNIECLVLLLQAYKRYKMSSRVRLYMADAFPAPSSSRYQHGWCLDQNKAPVFWASCPTAEMSSVPH
ncbi:uncharacterized protein MELLADRAFT_112229 [Melampsora larici-populina 98AG31]|uniref:Uncharacterized protein n=1 Tax=Melampsora larici-populina (strain 98AG31 / pathotype 3-4-7) TaxID=747676 RepID=F4S5S7_MELLP|nr:uncharacterized protein MELLADRAFT_112229 [Melampsora larici-populina 98AG31]EGF99950.1 hypothetical protein MELLADRAFT_112229 [Melampsora larici-populina 98AG31]